MGSAVLLKALIRRLSKKEFKEVASELTEKELKSILPKLSKDNAKELAIAKIKQNLAPKEGIVKEFKRAADRFKGEVSPARRNLIKEQNESILSTMKKNVPIKETSNANKVAGLDELDRLSKKGSAANLPMYESERANKVSNFISSGGKKYTRSSEFAGDLLEVLPSISPSKTTTGLELDLFEAIKDGLVDAKKMGYYSMEGIPTYKDIDQLLDINKDLFFADIYGSYTRGAIEDALDIFLEKLNAAARGSNLIAF